MWSLALNEFTLNLTLTNVIPSCVLGVYNPICKKLIFYFKIFNQFFNLVVSVTRGRRLKGRFGARNSDRCCRPIGASSWYGEFELCSYIIRTVFLVYIFLICNISHFGIFNSIWHDLFTILFMSDCKLMMHSLMGLRSHIFAFVLFVYRDLWFCSWSVRLLIKSMNNVGHTGQNWKPFRCSVSKSDSLSPVCEKIFTKYATFIY